MTYRSRCLFHRPSVGNLSVILPSRTSHSALASPAAAFASQWIPYLPATRVRYPRASSLHAILSYVSVRHALQSSCVVSRHVFAPPHLSAAVHVPVISVYAHPRLLRLSVCPVDILHQCHHLSLCSRPSVAVHSVRVRNVRGNSATRTSVPLSHATLPFQQRPRCLCVRDRVTHILCPF